MSGFIKTEENLTGIFFFWFQTSDFIFTKGVRIFVSVQKWSGKHFFSIATH